jgi:hypothetical protein
MHLRRRAGQDRRVEPSHERLDLADRLGLPCFPGNSATLAAGLRSSVERDAKKARATAGNRAFKPPVHDEATTA